MRSMKKIRIPRNSAAAEKFKIFGIGLHGKGATGEGEVRTESSLEARIDSALRVSGRPERLSGGSGWRGYLYPFSLPAPVR